MNGRTVFAVVLLAGGVLYVLGRRAMTAPAGTYAGPGLDYLAPYLYGGAYAQPVQAGYGQTPAAAAAAGAPRFRGQPQGPSTGAVLAKTGVGAGTSIGTAAVVGGVSSAALIATGIGAGVGLLSYFIVNKGLFRGGEEGITVNPNRDVWFKQFVALVHPGQEDDIALQFESVAAVYGMAGIDGNTAEREIKAVYDARTQKALETATRQSQATFAARGVQIGAW